MFDIKSPLTKPVMLETLTVLALIRNAEPEPQSKSEDDESDLSVSYLNLQVKS